MMLGKTAGGLFWMCRYLERSENIARLVEAGFRISLTRSASGEHEWDSVLAAVGCAGAYAERHGAVIDDKVIDFLIRDTTNPMSIMSVMTLARENARRTRTALTLELWEAINENWLNLKDLLAKPVKQTALPEVLAQIKRQSALVRGCLYGTLLRNDIFHFCQIGLLIERADNMARLLDVKYYVLLPVGSSVGSPIDNLQWEMLLRSASAERSFHWLHKGQSSPNLIARFLILDRQMPRSLAFCYDGIADNLACLADIYQNDRLDCLTLTNRQNAHLAGLTIDQIIAGGLHQFIASFIFENAALAARIEADYRFYT